MAWVQRARWYTERDLHEKAEAAWQRAVDLAGHDPLPWIHRGRWHAERGEHVKADADYSKAASLTPNELNKFLEAGWWVIGPYPANLDEFCPPQLDPDPSKPLYVMDPQTGFAEQPVAWQPVMTGKLGRIGVTGFKANTAFYALTNIYSPDDRTVLLGTNGIWDAGDPPHKVWVNGEPSLPVRFTSAWNLFKAHYPLALRAGRNTLLIKTSFSGAPTAFMAMLGDHPLNRGIDMARFGRFDAAVEPIDEACQLVPEWSAYPRRLAAQFALVAGDREQYERIATSCYQEMRNVDQPSNQGWLAWLLNQGPVDGIGPQQLSDWTDRWRSVTKPSLAVDRNVALARFRAGDALHVLDILQQNPKFGADSHCRSVLALALHKVGRTEEAKQLVEKAQTWSLRTLANYPGDGAAYVPDFYPTFREAYQVIHGNTIDIDHQLNEFLAARRKLWDERDPLTAAFDDAVRNAPADSNAYLTRGQRLADLGRLSEAEGDFNKAVELAPDDIGTLLARARFHAARGSVARARDVFEAALNKAAAAKAKEGDSLRLIVEREIARHEAVMDEWQAQSNHPWLRRVRADRQIQLRNWHQAAESMKHDDLFTQKTRLAGLSCLLGDDEGFRSACRSLPEQLPRDWDQTTKDYHLLSVLGLRPLTADLAAGFTRLMEAHLSDTAGPWFRSALSAALYRHGRYDEALVHLNVGLPVKMQWQGFARVWPLLAMTHWQLGHHDEARKWLARSQWWVDFAREAADARHAIGPDNITYNDWLFAQVFCAEAKLLIDGPEAAAAEEAQRSIRQTELERQRVSRAEAAWRKADELAGNDALAWLQRTRFYTERDMPEKAEAAWRRAVELAGKDADAHNGLGDTLYQQKKLGEAVTCYHQAIEIDPKHAAAHNNLGLAIRDLSQRLAVGPDPKGYDAVARVVDQGAGAYLRRLDQWPPPGNHNWFLNAMIYLAAARPEAYRRTCAQLVEQFGQTDEPQVVALLVWCCKLLPDAVADFDAVVRLGEKALVKLPDNGRLMRDLAALLYRAGRFEQALKRLEESVQLRPEKKSIVWDWLWLAMVEHGLGDSDKARNWLRQAQEWIDQNDQGRGLELRLLRAEAEELLGITPTEPKRK
jgi:tetratricopeptide (TPR) repeat protein